MGTVYLLLAAALATAASLTYVTYFTEMNVAIAFFIAILLWSPSNAVFTKAQTKVTNVAVALIVFSISVTMSDTLGGIFVQGIVVKNLFTLLLGLASGILVIYFGSRAKDFDRPDVKKEIVLYVIGILSLAAAWMFRSYWYVLVLIYAITDLFGAVLSLRLLGYISSPANDKMRPVYEYAIGVVAFLPITFVAILLLDVLSNVAVAGPASTIMSCGVALVGSTLLTSGKLKFVDIGMLLFAVVSVLLIYASF